jgi:hypothetical protein
MKNGPVEQPKKIFFIGFHKTGTGYYNSLFKKLGFRSLHHWIWTRGNSLVLRRYDVFLDGCLHRYETLYRKYPDAFYILNTRELTDWLVSRMKWNQERYGHFPQWCLSIMNLYHRYSWGNDCYFNLELVKEWILERQKYHHEVRAFFESKQKPLLVLDIGDEDKLVKLWKYLELPEARLAEFQSGKKENQSAIDPARIDQYEQLARQAMRELNLPVSPDII